MDWTPGIITVFCRIDDALKRLLQGLRLRRHRFRQQTVEDLESCLFSLGQCLHNGDISAGQLERTESPAVYTPMVCFSPALDTHEPDTHPGPLPRLPSRLGGR